MPRPESKDRLKGILTHHVPAATVMAHDVTKMNSARAVQGQGPTV